MDVVIGCAVAVLVGAVVAHLRVPGFGRLPRWGAACVGLGWGAVVLACVDRVPWWWWPVPLLLGWWGVLLAVCDLRVRRLPHTLVLPAYPAAGVLVAVAAIGSGHPVRVAVGAVVGAVAWAGLHAAVRWLRPGALGGGDVTVAGVLGGLTGAVSPATTLLAVLGAVVLAALVAVVAVARGRRTLAYGPPMLLAAWLVALGAHPG